MLVVKSPIRSRFLLIMMKSMAEAMYMSPAQVKIGNAKTGAMTASIGGTSPEVAFADPQGNVYAGLVGGQLLQQFVRK